MALEASLCSPLTLQMNCGDVDGGFGASPEKYAKCRLHTRKNGSQVKHNCSAISRQNVACTAAPGAIAGQVSPPDISQSSKPVRCD